jgi:hypothetical protein
MKTQKQYKTLKPAKKRPKYGNVKTAGFDSKGESKRHNELLLLQKAGLISDLTKQPKIVLLESFLYYGERQRPITYRPDFYYLDLRHNQKEGGLKTYEDYKSVITAKDKAYKIKSKLFKKMLLQYSDTIFIETIK